MHTVGPTEFKKLLAEGWLSPLAMANRWGISEFSIHKLIKQGKLKYVVSVDGRYKLLDPKQARP